MIPSIVAQLSLPEQNMTNGIMPKSGSRIAAAAINLLPILCNEMAEFVLDVEPNQYPDLDKYYLADKIENL